MITTIFLSPMQVLCKTPASHRAHSQVPPAVVLGVGEVSPHLHQLKPHHHVDKYQVLYTGTLMPVTESSLMINTVVENYFKNISLHA